MVLILQDKINLSKIRLEKAKDCLRDSEILISTGGYKSSANRSYYAVFHGLRAVLVFADYDSKKHSGIISEFRRLYIKEGIFSEDVSRVIGRQFDLRSLSDYDDFFEITEQTAVKALEEAKFVLSEIEKYLNTVYCE